MFSFASPAHREACHQGGVPRVWSQSGHTGRNSSTNSKKIKYRSVPCVIPTNNNREAGPLIRKDLAKKLYSQSPTCKAFKTDKPSHTTTHRHIPVPEHYSLALACRFLPYLYIFPGLQRGPCCVCLRGWNVSFWILALCWFRDVVSFYNPDWPQLHFFFIF